MKIAVLEVVSAGFFGPDPEPSLLREGLAMWSAIIADLMAVPGLVIDTLIQTNCHQQQLRADHVHLWLIDDVAESTVCWEAACENADAALIIAPEFSGMLANLVSAVPQQVMVWNALPETIGLCSDKFELCEHLQRNGISTIPTRVLDWSCPPDFRRGSYVIKPRDGAGSYLVRMVSSLQEWSQVRQEYVGLTETQPLIQPCIAGRSVSMAGWFGDSGMTLLPIAEQHLSEDGQYRYLGGQIPANMTESEAAAVSHLFRNATESLPGLRGYIGADMILPIDDPLSPVLVEINPRFTTSYVGYRQLWSRSPWPEWLSGKPLDWSWNAAQRTVRFRADGTWE
ncbi:ATP-grasp domain-containing protein [bacterium]|nr:ATP-grasp domain-containing protein [bacterium]